MALQSGLNVSWVTGREKLHYYRRKLAHNSAKISAAPDLSVDENVVEVNGQIWRLRYFKDRRNNNRYDFGILGVIV